MIRIIEYNKSGIYREIWEYRNISLPVRLRCYLHSGGTGMADPEANVCIFFEEAHL